MKINSNNFSNDQLLLSTIPRMLSGHCNQRHRSIIHDFKYLFNYIDKNAEKPVSLLYSVGVVILDAEHVLFRRVDLSRYMNYSKSTFSHFLQRHHFTRVPLSTIQSPMSIERCRNDRLWSAYTIKQDSTFGTMLLGVQFLWADREESFQRNIGLVSPINSLLLSFQITKLVDV